jgi:hypothetical protein
VGSCTWKGQAPLLPTPDDGCAAAAAAAAAAAGAATQLQTQSFSCSGVMLHATRTLYYVSVEQT